MIVLYHSIHGEQYGDKCTYLEENVIFKFFPWLKVQELKESERPGPDIPALRPNHNDVPITRRKKGYITFSKTHSSIIRDCA